MYGIFLPGSIPLGSGIPNEFSSDENVLVRGELLQALPSFIQSLQPTSIKWTFNQR